MEKKEKNPPNKIPEPKRPTDKNNSWKRNNRSGESNKQTSNTESGEITGEIIKQNKDWVKKAIHIMLQKMEERGRMHRKWVSGTMTYIYKGKKDQTEIQNYRPITLLNIIYKIWAIIMTEKLAVVMNVVTTELQTSYKKGRSTLDILTIINKQIKTDETKHIIMLDLSKACDSANRELPWTALYKKGLPEPMIRRIRMGHEDTKLRPKAKGTLGKKQINNKGVFQGSPLSALLFIIYFDHMLEMYAKGQKTWKTITKYKK